VTRQRHAEIHALCKPGMGVTAISKAQRLERKTVRRYARATTADELII
jgi:hypothetical protein